MNPFYPCSEQSAHIRPVRYRRRRLHFCGHILFLLALFLMKAGWVNGQDDNHLDGASDRNEIIGAGYDDYGAYVDIIITFFDDNDDDSWIEKGRIYCTPSGGNKKEIIYLNSWNQDDGGDDHDYEIYIAPRIGRVRVRGIDLSDDNNYGTGGFSWIRDDGGNHNVDAAQIAALEIRWYVPGDYAGKNLSFSYTRDVHDAGGDDEEIVDSGSPNNFIGGSHTATPLSTLTISPWKYSVESGKMAIGYSFSAKNIYDTKITFAGQVQDGGTSEVPSGSFNSPLISDTSRNLPVTAHAIVKPFKYIISPGGIFGGESVMDSVYLASYSQTQDILIPAYIWPDSLSVTYDGADTVTLSWQVPLPEDEDFITGGNFEIQRSTDPDFEENVKSIGTIPYDAHEEMYSMEDNLSDLKGGTQVYYRLRRTESSAKWGWGETRDAQVEVIVADTVQADTARLDETDRLQAIITWEPFQGVWTNGTTFTLKKENVTTGETTNIEVTEEEARSGEYIDESIQYCKQFYYSIELKQGNGYPSPEETDVPGTVLGIAIGNISDLEASKGYFTDRVELNLQTAGGFDSYLVGRREYGSSADFLQIASVPATAATKSVSIVDNRGAPGIYYEYRVVGAVSCGDSIRYSRDTLYDIGFRNPTGNIYGRITYENGQAVRDAMVRLENDDEEQLGQSLYLNGSAGSYLQLDSLRIPFSDSTFTIEAWIRPDDDAPASQVIFSRNGQYEVGFDNAGLLYFSYNGQRVSGAYHNTPGTFVHVTGIHSLDTLRLMLNDSLIAEAIHPFAPAPASDSIVYFGRNEAGNHFRGYLDEVRAWNTALSVENISRLYNRLLSGGEEGLTAYWRFNETIVDQFYDLSHQDDHYNRNDGNMNPSQVKRSDIIPTPGQLSLRAYTDSTGNYMITGIPYFGNGSTWSIVPLLGTHQFDPVLERRLLSAEDPSFTVNFVDKSSFPVSGYVYYLDGTVPVEGVQFQIDGRYAQKDNGELIQTDVNGKFTISVPVGTHEVKAVKNNHVFVNQGKITDRFGRDLNYQGPISERILRDSTTIRFIGRVAGGAHQESLPLGHSVSRNNLGKDISITMRLPTEGKYDLHSGSQDTTVWVPHQAHPGDDPEEVHETRIIYDQDKVVIYPDSITGEFMVNLIPEKFIVDHVSVTGWGDLLDGEALAMDFTNKFQEQFSMHSYTDSTENGGGWDYTDYVDSVAYNDSYQFIERVSPSMSIVQVEASGTGQKWFGDETYSTLDGDGEEIEIPVVDTTKTGREMYLLGYPIFRQGTEYYLRINAFEEYPFYERVLEDGTPVIAEEGGREVRDRVPTSDGQVTLFNTIRNGSTSADMLSLDSTGTGYYTFLAGDPAITAPGLKSLSVTVRFGQATDLNWSWLGQPKLEGFVMGLKMTGTDFVTAGPDKLLAVLRDPPGSRSYSFIEEGSTFRSSSAYKTSVDQAANAAAIALMGSSETAFTGTGAGVIVKISQTDSEVGVGVVHEEHFNHSNKKETSTTITSRFQTSDAPVFVGAPGDVYIGHSTNITYGQTRNAIIIHREDKKAADSVLYDPALHDPDTSPDYLVVMREGINFGEQFGTLFAYPQQHIVKVLIPNLTHIRNSMLLPPGTNGQTLANNSGNPVYVSKLEASDPNFGKSNDDMETFGERSEDLGFNDGESYTIYFPEDMDYRTDTIMVLNQYIKDWERRIADNEKQKVETGNPENRSFHAGSPFTHSEQFSETKTETNSFNIILATRVFFDQSFEIKEQGIKLTLDESIGTSQGGEFEDSEETTRTIGYTLASDGTDDYISVDIAKPDDGGFVFRTLGGATACPYEGEEVTQYYNPGTVINVATQRIEVPALTVDQAVVNDVPASQKASYTLRIKNESEARLPTTLMLSYVDTDSIKGATISVDGLPIGGTGRPIPVQYGQTVTKVITLSKGPEAMDYDNIPIILKSACQYDPTGYQETIADTVLISAHFVPACGNVNIKSPTGQWILNTKSPLNDDDKRYLPLVIDQFDLSNSLFHRIELQFKPAASGTWITAMKFYADSAAYKEAKGEKLFITNPQEILYNLEMDDASFNDQGYDIRAVSICKLGPDDFITTPSPVISGLKDTYSPRLFGSAQPANGVLGVSDEIRLNFNETIAAGLLTYPDFQVRGIRNGSIGNHSVSAILDGNGDYLATEFEKNLSGKSLTMELWVLPDAGTASSGGTLISHGDLNQSMELALTTDNFLEVTVGGKTVRSEQPLPVEPGEWAHVALVYHASGSDAGNPGNAAGASVSAFYNFVEVIHNVPAPAYMGNGHFELGRSIRQSGNYFKGKMHETRIWGEALTALRLQTNSLRILSGAENGLLAYYPMNEGKGSVAFDKAHGSNARLVGEWSTPPGKALAFSGNGQLKIKTGSIPITDEMDYTMALWFKGDPGQNDAALASNGRGEGDELGGSYDLFFLGFEGGKLTFRNNNFRIQVDGDYLDDEWHHVALAVNRTSGTAQLYADGELLTFFDARKLGGVAAPFIYLGARGWQDANDAFTVHFDRHFSGEIDEFRLWNTYLNQTLINADNNTRLEGTELGLLAYYPFETYVEFQNNQELAFTLKDMKMPHDPKIDAPIAEKLNVTETDDKAPIKDRGPVENLQFDFVVNDDALIITLLEPRQAVDKTIVTFRVKDVRDLNGNALQSPVTWSAYINRNQLSWSDPEFTLSKELYAPMEFESYVVNSGGNIQNFRLNNLPPWLDASPMSGTVDPLGRQKITFTVHQGLNIGSYDEVIYMLNDNDESEALPLTLTVKGEEPDWQVNPADFNYSMTVYGKLQIDHIFSSDENDMLAVFQGGTCVGVTRNSYSAGNDLWYALLTIYGNEPSGSELEFRIWDASTGKIYQASPSMELAFQSDAIAGTSRQPVIFRGEELIFQELDLHQGWNWISLNVTGPAMNDVAATLSNGLWQAGDIVKNVELGFHQYSVSSGWVGSMEGFNNRSLFMISSSSDQSLSIGGIPVDPAATPIEIKGNRWNYISYLPQVSMTVTEALAGYAASEEDVIKSQTGFAMYDSQNGWMGSLTHLQPGQGYMLYRKAAGNESLQYPTLGGSLINGLRNQPQIALKGGSGQDAGGLTTANRLIAAGHLSAADQLQMPVAGNYRYASNMTVVAALDHSFVLQPGDRVLAYAGNELRGKAGAITLPGTGEQRFFINIGGEEPESVRFEIERRGRVIARSATVISYLNNGLTGTLKQPLIIVTENRFGKITTFPNPFGKQVNVRVELTDQAMDAGSNDDGANISNGDGANVSNGNSSASAELQMAVYDVKGNKVFEGPVERITAGPYLTSWNGRNAGGQPCPPGVYFIGVTVNGLPLMQKVIKIDTYQ